LIILNAFFAASEMALVSLNERNINALAKKGNKKAILIKNLLKDPSRFLATIQIGITLAGFLASAFASESFADKLAGLLQNLGVGTDYQVLKVITVTIITILLSYFTLVFGELVPKRLAMQSPDKISMLAAAPIYRLSYFSRPFVKLLTLSTNFFVNIFGGDNQGGKNPVTEEEIIMMIEEGAEKGTILKNEKEMISNVFNFTDIVVSDIMTHRTEVFALPIDLNFKDVVNFLKTHKHTRLPVYDNSIDNIIGILHVKDLVKFLDAPDSLTFDLTQIIKKPYFVPESKKAAELFKEFQKKKTHMAIVIDEYGGTAGIVTMEDLLEEIVGNIFDEYDQEQKDYIQIDDNTYLFNGMIALDEVEKIIGISMPVEDYDTLSGFIIGQLGRIPAPGENPIIEFDNLIFKVEESGMKRIRMVKICRT
jgi:putative hemolysin